MNADTLKSMKIEGYLQREAIQPGFPTTLTSLDINCCERLCIGQALQLTLSLTQLQTLKLANNSFTAHSLERFPPRVFELALPYLKKLTLSDILIADDQHFPCLEQPRVAPELGIRWHGLMNSDEQPTI